MQKKVTLKDGTQAIIRPLKKTDSPKALMKYINELIEENTFLSIDKKVTLKEETKWFENKLKAKRQKKYYGLVAEIEGEIVSITRMELGIWKESSNAEVGISVKKKYRGSGLGKMMMQEVIIQGKKILNPKRVFLNVLSPNKIGLSLYKKLGFVKIATLPKWTKHRGRYVDKIFMELKKK